MWAKQYPCEFEEMKEIIEEFGGTMLACIIGAVVLIGVTVFIKETGILANLASAYADYFYGQGTN